MKSKSLACLALLLSSVVAVVAQTSSFTYQGQLTANGNPAVGLYDLRFTLHDAATLGNQVGSPLTNGLVNVSNGVFTVTLDFGSVAFDGSSRWLAIGVRTNGAASDFTTLAPRQLLTATPYAIRAANYNGTLAATNLTGKISDTNLSANVALLTNQVVFTRSVTATNFIGSGLGLTNLPATNLVGTIPDARLSTNVALLNTSNAVFLGAVSATNFYGFGGGLTNVPGRKFDSVPTATNIQAQANYGYLATNDSTPVTVTLPLTADIPAGYTVRVSGSGAAGWIVAQNAGQTILVGNLLNTVGVNWTTNGNGLLNWKAIASSADGSKLVAVVSSGNIYTSSNYGAAWTQRAAAFGNLNWSSVCSSADGTKLMACVNGGLIYTSIDSGANWTQRPTSGVRSWTGIACSLDGTRVTACAFGGGVFISTDSGVAWPASPSLGAANYTAIASSGSGLNLAATIQGGQIWISTNAGAIGSWTGRGPNPSWTCIASSADGSTLVAGANAGANYLHVSTDYGVNWVPGTIGASWSGVACSADGARMIAVANGGGVYVSMDSGLTWLLRGNLPTGSIYNGAACSSDGTTMAAVANSNPIYVSSKSSTTIGTAGQLIGARLAAVDLQHVGNGVFIPISYVGTIRAK